ncbi:hypothetical protein J132_03561 [Termitomyces sp. J132]|nr:hypothetical protein J132_03561 [Termitomyces sp. J132]
MTSLTLVCFAVSVMAAKSTTWFELFWVPLIPFSRKHMWLCSICHWSLPITHGCVAVLLLVTRPRLNNLISQAIILVFNQHKAMTKIFSPVMHLLMSSKVPRNTRVHTLHLTLRFACFSYIFRTISAIMYLIGIFSQNYCSSYLCRRIFRVTLKDFDATRYLNT